MAITEWETVPIAPTTATGIIESEPRIYVVTSSSGQMPTTGQIWPRGNH